MMRFGSQVVLLCQIAVAPAYLAGQRHVSRLDGRVPPALAAAVGVLVDSAAARRLPSDPLIDKAIEGVAKGVVPERVLTAVHMVLDQLDTAAAAIRAGDIRTPDSEAIEAGAFALAAGVSGREIARLVKGGTTSGSPAATLRVAGTLAALGVPAAQAVDLILGTIRHGGSAADVLSLPARVQSQVTHGETPSQAAAGIARSNGARGSPPGGPKPGRGQGNPHKP